MPAASSVLVSGKSSPPLTPKWPLHLSPRIVEEGMAFCAGGLQIKIGRTFKGGSTTLLEEPLDPTAEDERRCTPATSDTLAKEGNACPLTRTWACNPSSLAGDDRADALSFGILPQAGGCSQGELEPYAWHSSFSSPTAQHEPEVLHGLASQPEAPQKKFP